MKKIIYFDWFQSATEFYRSSGVLQYINNPGLEITRSTVTNISYATLAGYDTVILERPSSQESMNIVRLAKDMRIKVIVDYDDDILHLTQYNPMYETYKQQMPSCVECLALADEVWVTTKSIVRSFSLYNKNIHVIPNAHNDYLFKLEDKKPFNVGVKLAMWRGGYSHEEDVYDIGIPEMLIDVINNNMDWTFKFIGQRFKYMEKRCGDNYVSQEGASTVQFYKMIHKENPCIAFYPLADTVFNRAKSNICFIEATYAGAAFFGNKALPEFSHDSILPFSELRNGIEKYTRRSLQKANKLAWEHIQKHLLLSNINKLREKRLLA